MKVKDIMTTEAVRQCGPEAKLQEAAKVMKTGNCGALPVVDKNQQLVGIVTDRDIALSLASGASPAGMVKDIMSSHVHTVTDSDDVSVALEKMRTRRVGRLPVVTKENHLRGIVSIHNVLSHTTPEEISRNMKPDGENVFRTIKALSDRYASADKEKSKSTR